MTEEKSQVSENELATEAEKFADDNFTRSIAEVPWNALKIGFIAGAQWAQDNPSPTESQSPHPTSLEGLTVQADGIIEARSYFDNRWPDNLTSGVMFFGGQRITREEFEGHDLHKSYGVCENPTPTEGLTVQAHEKEILEAAKEACEMKSMLPEGRIELTAASWQARQVNRFVQGAKWAQEKPSLDSPKGLGVQPDIKEQKLIDALDSKLMTLTEQVDVDNFDWDLSDEDRVKEALEAAWTLTRSYDNFEITLTDGSVTEDSIIEAASKAGTTKLWTDYVKANERIAELEKDLAFQKQVSDNIRADRAEIANERDELKTKIKYLEQVRYDKNKQIDELKAEVNRLKSGIENAVGCLVGDTVDPVDYKAARIILRELLAPKKGTKP